MLEAVILRIAPAARVLHLTHGVPPQAVAQGALLLADAVPYLPVGAHVAVVDPGVGTSRRAVVLESTDGRRFVGPDNGLLPWAAEACGGIVAAHEITSPAVQLAAVSATFHGRDVFAPAAAHLAAGVATADVGPALDPSTLVTLSRAAPAVSEGRVEADCVRLDGYGNAWLGATPEDVDAAGIGPGAQVAIEVDGEARGSARRGATFGEVAEGEVVLYATSWGRVALGVRGGNAARMLGIAPGMRVLLLSRSPGLG